MASAADAPVILQMGQPVGSGLLSLSKLPSALPALPDPSMLFHMSSSLVNIREEILQGMSNIQSLREAVKAAGPDALPLPPLDDTFLLPLPGPPQPSHRHRAVTQKSSKGTAEAAKPVERPALVDKGQDDASLEDILNAFRDTLSEADRKQGLTATAGASETAVRFVLASGAGSGWLVLNDAVGSNNDRRIAKISLFGVSFTKPSILAVPTQAPYAGVSAHLNSLSLTLREFLFRLPALPALLRASCFRCGRHLRLGVAPTHTGYLPGVQRESNDQDGSMENNEGRWVIWHPACAS